MNRPPHLLDPAQRASEKERSRAADAVALANGRLSLAELREQNEAFARFGVPVRIDLAAARALA